MDGGTDTPKNGITLCKKCHDSIHAGEWVLEKKAITKAKHRTKGWVIGSVRSLKEKVITLRTKFDDNFPVSYRKSILLFRFNRIVYSY